MMTAKFRTGFLEKFQKMPKGKKVLSALFGVVLAAALLALPIFALAGAPIDITVDDRGNVVVDFDIEHGVILDGDFIHVSIPGRFGTIGTRDVNVAVPDGWSYELNRETKRSSEFIEAEGTYTIITVSHGWNDAGESNDFVGIAPLVVAGSEPAGFAVVTLASPFDLAAWNTALTSTPGNLVISVPNDIATPGAVAISGNRHVIVASSGTDLNNSLVEHAPPSATHTMEMGGDVTARHFHVGSDATLTLSHIILDGRVDVLTPPFPVRGGINVNAANLNMLDGAVIRNCLAPNGGGVALVANSIFTMLGGTIGDDDATLGNTADLYEGGGGVLVSGGSQFEMNAPEGRIVGNSSTRGADSAGGGGVRLTGGSGSGVSFVPSSFTMIAGTIENNNAEVGGGGVDLRDGALFTMDGAAALVDENTSVRHGGGVNIESGARGIIMDGTISNNEVIEETGGGVYLSSTGTLTMYGGEIVGNRTLEHEGGGGGVRLAAGGSQSSFYMYGGVISDNRAEGAGSVRGGGVSVGSNNTFVMAEKDGTVPTIVRNTATQRGGGVNVHGTNSIFTMTGGIIGGSPADRNIAESSGGGVSVALGGTFVMSEGDDNGTSTYGVISHNIARGTGGANGGGGVHMVQNNSTFSLEAGIIEQNRATNGGGVMLLEGTASFDMSGGYIQGHTQNAAASAGAITVGGGVFVSGGNVTFNMSGGIIGGNPNSEGNRANQGGGVRVGGGSTFTMTGGDIEGNTATSNASNNGGGGVYVVGANSEFILSAAGGNSGTLYNNTANRSGGGVFVDGGGTLTMNSGEIISNNANGVGALDGGGGVMINGSSTTTFLNLNGGSIGTVLHPNRGLHGGGVRVSNGTTSLNGVDVVGNVATSSITGHTPNGNGGAVFLASTVAGNTTVQGNTVIAGNIAVDGGGIRAESGAGALAIQDGQIGDVFNAARTETAGNVATSSGGGISVGNRPFTLVGDASISGNRTELRGGGMHIFDATTTGRERVMDGATVGGSTQAHGNRSRMSGGGLYIDESASFTMRGGTIIHNHADGPRVAGEAQGGGVCVSGGAFIMGNPTGTTSLAGDPVITRNGSEFRGGGIHGAVHARITIYSGEISLNFAAIENGGGMDLRTGAQAVMEGGVIVNNSAREGAGVFLGTAPARLTMNSGAIEYNHSTQGGAGVAMLSGTLTMNNDAAIEDNRAGTRAGGILMFANGTMIMNDDATVRDNRADTTAGGIYVQNAHLTMNDDAMVRDNRAESTGGVHMSAGTFTMNDGNIIANNALGFGGSGGVHIGGGTFTMNDGSIGTTSQPNRGRFGGGVRLASGNTNMNGGSIVGNIATNVPTGTVPICNGGGVFLEPDATFTMNSGNISDNRAINGGGVRAQEGATFSLAGSGAKSITRNIATNDGGGVWVAENAYMTMQPNSSDSLHITYNQATGTTSMGGGIFTDRYYYFDPLPLDGEYTNLILLGVNFDNNSASTIEIPPANASALTNISFADTSDYDHPLNNSDINYENNSDDLPRELLLIKTLELSEDTTLPVPPPSFGFSFDPVQVQVQTSPSVSSRLPADFDDLVTNPQNVEIDPITGSGTPRTYTGSLDLWGLFYGIADAGDFPGGGVFAWNVSEIDGSSNTLPPSLMTYDASRFQIWAWVESDGSLYEIRIFPIVEGEGDSYTLGPKVEYINFNNQYSRQINRILEISKTVTADHNRPYFVNFQQLFDFTLTLSGANVPATLNATIVNTTTQAALPGDRNPVEITGGSASFQLRHNETLQVPSLPPGTSFVVVESAHLEFAPELEVILDDLVVHTDSALANNSLSSGTHTLTTGTGRNAVDFENVHQYTPLTGFTFSDIPLLVAVLPIFALIAYAALRNRKAKEELSL